MRLWVLKRPDDKVGCDQYAGFVVRAESEEQARGVILAQKRSITMRDGTRHEYSIVDPTPHGNWVDREAVCEPIEQDGEPAVILSDYNAG